MKVVLDYKRPTFKERLKRLKPNGFLSFLSFFLNFFPILKWIRRYNFSWLFQDAIAGITVGLLLVPQGIAYAKIANLDPQYGLYTSFVGVTIYCLFGTSKDISIGPITVVSLLVGEAIHKVTETHPDVTGPEIAVCLSLFCGIIISFIGLIKLGILVDFISGPSIAGYMSGSAITIGLGQWPKLFGLSNVNTHQPPYLIFYEFFKQITTIHIDAAFGLSSLFILYLIKFGTGHLAAKLPRFKKPLFFMGIMRNGLIVIIGTLISFAINMGKSTSPFKIIKEVPAGLDAIALPYFRMDIISECMGVLPSIIIILILEHVSVAKSFGRINDYEIQPNQEILVIGISNIVGSFIGAYPCTGAFSRTAVMARSGSKTPIAGVFTGLVVILALYVLTPAFYFIPEAVLAAVVVHAVSDLVSGPSYILELYRTSIYELLVFFISVAITCFIDVETAIYTSVGLSLIIMLLKFARPPVKVLARSPLKWKNYSTINQHPYQPKSQQQRHQHYDTKVQHYIYVDEMDHHYSKIIEAMPPGILVIQLTDSILYPNAGHVAEKLTRIGKTRTRNGNSNLDKKSLPWNESLDTSQNHHRKPLLGAVVLDMHAVHSIDSTGLQALSCVRTTLERHADQAVEWHFVGLQNAIIRHDLLSFGFGTLTDQMDISSPHSDQSSTSSSMIDQDCPIVIHKETLPSSPSPPSSSQNNNNNNNNSRLKPPLPPLPPSQQHPLNRSVLLNNSNDNDEKSILESWRQMAFLDMDMNRFSSMNSLFDPMEMDIDPYYASIEITNDPHDQLPIEKYPCFHWDVDTAVRTICDRWHNKKAFEIFYQA